LLLALAIFAIVAAAILALATSASRQGRRMIDKSQSAQLEQFLLAGITATEVHLNAQAPARGDAWDVELPSALSSQNASLHIDVISSDARRASVSIHARFNGKSTAQTADFALNANRWSLQSASLDE
jgi:Tfp pilus assembly protein PilE